MLAGGMANPRPALGVVMMLSEDVSPDTDWQSVLMCRERLALLDTAAGFLDACLNLLVVVSSAECQC